MTSLEFHSLLTSVGVATLASILAVMFGGSLAALFAATDVRAVPLWASLALLPFLCPAAVWTLGQMYSFGAGGLLERWWGDGWRPFLNRMNPGQVVSAALVLAQIHAPLAMLLLWKAWTRLHDLGWEAARFGLSPLRHLRWLLRALRWDLSAVFLLVWALCVGNFAVPHVLQCRTYTVEIYLRLTNYLDPPGAVRASWPLVLLAVSAALLAAIRDGRQPTQGAAAVQHPRWPLGRWRFAVHGLLGAWLGITILLPAAALVSACRSWPLFVQTLRDAAPETENTLLVGLAAAGVAALAALGLGLATARHGSLAGTLGPFACLSIPTLLIGVLFAWTVPASFRPPWWNGLLMLALAFRGFPFGWRLFVHRRRGLPREWFEAAELPGVSRATRVFRLHGPLCVEPLVTGALVAYVLAVGDVEITQILCDPGGGTLALRLFTFLHFGPEYVIAGLAVLQLLVALVPVVVYVLVTSRGPRVV